MLRSRLISLLDALPTLVEQLHGALASPALGEACAYYRAFAEHMHGFRQDGDDADAEADADADAGSSRSPSKARPR